MVTSARIDPHALDHLLVVIGDYTLERSVGRDRETEVPCHMWHDKDPSAEHTRQVLEFTAIHCQY